MTVDGAKIIEQGVIFAIAVVRYSILYSANREIVRKSFIPIFGDVPIILASQTDTGFIYNGRKDIVDFLYSIKPQQIPWKRYTV